MITGFKDWQVVCDALAEGRQSLLLRKGGIHEGRAGFSFAHDEFFLFPTRFHNQATQVREGLVREMPEWQDGDAVEITHFVHALSAVTLTDWGKTAALEPFHIYTQETVRQRFDWQGKEISAGSIHVALARVYRMAEPWTLTYEKSFGGCRSWIDLPEPPANWRDSLVPVLDDAAFSRIAQALEQILRS